MRTTLDIDADVLDAAKDIARRNRVSAGRVISDLVRRGLTAGPASGASEPKPVHGFRPFPARGKLVTDAIVDRIRDEDGV